MQPIKMFGLAALGALLALVSASASSAMAESTTLCTGDGTGCGITHVHWVTPGSSGSGELEVECDVLFLGDSKSPNNLGIPLVITGNFTYSNCTTDCTVTEENAPSTIEVLKLGHETADVTFESLFYVDCGFIDCSYDGVGQLGTAKGVLLSSVANGSISFSGQRLNEEGEKLLCPDELTLELFITPLSATYINS